MKDSFSFRILKVCEAVRGKEASALFVFARSGEKRRGSKGKEENVQKGQQQYDTVPTVQQPKTSFAYLIYLALLSKYNTIEL